MNSEILEKYKLERSLPTQAAKAFEKLLNEANESYVLLWEKEKHCKIRGVQFWNFTVYCPETNFADAFFHLGLKWKDTVLPEWHKYVYGAKGKKK